MAAAMIDRLAHHGHLLTFEGQSYRLRNALMRVKKRGKIREFIWQLPGNSRGNTKEFALAKPGIFT